MYVQWEIFRACFPTVVWWTGVKIIWNITCYKGRWDHWNNWRLSSKSTWLTKLICLTKTNNNALPSRLKVALRCQAVPEVERSRGSRYFTGYKMSAFCNDCNTRKPWTVENSDQDLKMSGFVIRFVSVMCLLVILTGPSSPVPVSPTYPSDPQDPYYESKIIDKDESFDCS